MRDLSFYVERVRAFPGRPLLVWAYLEGEPFWWNLHVVFTPIDEARSWDGAFDYEDPELGHRLIPVDVLEGRSFAQLLLASPPGYVFGGERGYTVRYPDGYEPDLDGRDQEATKQLGARLAQALDVPFAFEPADAPSRPWWEFPEGQAAVQAKVGRSGC